MKRYYLCDIIGDGTFGNFYRPKLADIGVDARVTEMQTDPATGVPTKPWCLVLVADRNHGKLQNVPGVDPLPDYPMDGKVSAINAVARQAMLNRLAARSINGNVVQTADGYREVIRGIGRELNPLFDENNFDVADV